MPVGFSCGPHAGDQMGPSWVADGCVDWADVMTNVFYYCTVIKGILQVSDVNIWKFYRVNVLNKLRSGCNKCVKIYSLDLVIAGRYSVTQMLSVLS